MTLQVVSVNLTRLGRKEGKTALIKQVKEQTLVCLHSKEIKRTLWLEKYTINLKVF